MGVKSRIHLGGRRSERGTRVFGLQGSEGQVAQGTSDLSSLGRKSFQGKACSGACCPRREACEAVPCAASERLSALAQL